jgi:hypothetical protein
MSDGHVCLSPTATSTITLAIVLLEAVQEDATPTIDGGNQKLALLNPSNEFSRELRKRFVARAHNHNAIATVG